MYRLENQLKGLMLQKVEFIVDNKVIKKGKIRIFNTKQFFIKFRLESNNDTKEFEIPYPFRVEVLNNGYLFDYCLSAFIPKTEEVYWKMKTLNKDEASKIHEKYLFVRTLSA
jgi:hypothetical protein